VVINPEPALAPPEPSVLTDVISRLLEALQSLFSQNP
jgi:hypothetical protein